MALAFNSRKGPALVVRKSCGGYFTRRFQTRSDLEQFASRHGIELYDSENPALRDFFGA